MGERLIKTKESNFHSTDIEEIKEYIKAYNLEAELEKEVANQI